MSFLVQWTYLVSLALWLGGIVFFSFFTTPVVFSHLPKELASEFLAALFPRYYALGYTAGGLMLLASLLEAALLRQIPWIRLGVVVLMLGCTLYAGLVLRPQVHELKVQLRSVEEGTELGNHLKASFDQLHRFSVILNLIVLVGGLILIGIVALRLRL